MKRFLGLSILSVILGGASVAFAQGTSGQTCGARHRHPSDHNHDVR